MTTAEQIRAHLERLVIDVETAYDDPAYETYCYEIGRALTAEARGKS